MKSLFAACLLVMGLQMGAFCQSRCDTYYDFTEVPPTYQGGEEAIVKHGAFKIVPLISAFYKKIDEFPIASFRGAVLYINRQGVVTDVIITDRRVPVALQEILCDEFMKMKGWKPARHNKQAVCATYTYTIQCMSWQE